MCSNVTLHVNFTASPALTIDHAASQCFIATGDPVDRERVASYKTETCRTKCAREGASTMEKLEGR